MLNNQVKELSLRIGPLVQGRTELPQVARRRERSDEKWPHAST